MARLLGPGDRAPDFTLASQDGTSCSLDALVADGPIVLYFYPRDETPGCTAEACAFRDASEDFEAAGVRVVGISSDSVGSHGRFAERHGLGFTLLSDEGGGVRRAFGVPRTLGVLDGRVTFVIDSEKTIRHVYNSQLRADRHVLEALAAVRRLPGARA